MESIMSLLRAFIPLSAAALVAACATPVPTDEHAAHRAASGSPTAEPRMKAMQEMHEKMMNAKTPEERQALMTDHMKAMHDGMGMMKGMSGKGAPADITQRQHTLEKRMDTMQMMMEMMMDRLPPQPAAPAKK